MNKDYTKIKLRDFRKNLTQLKDSLAAGEIYEVVERGRPLGYFVSTDYEIKKKKTASMNKTLYDLLKNTEPIELKDEIKHVGSDYMKGYRILLEKKYLKK